VTRNTDSQVQNKLLAEGTFKMVTEAVIYNILKKKKKTIGGISGKT